MGKSIRSKRMKALRTIKRQKLMPRENILLEQRAAIIRTIQGESVDESTLPVLPEKANAPVRFEHTRDGKAPFRHTLATRYGHLVNNNTCVTKFNTLDALKERYDKAPAVKKEEGMDTGSSSSSVTPALRKKKLSSAAKQAELPSMLTRRRSGRGRDRSEKSIAASSTPVKAEQVDDDDAAMADDNEEQEVEEIDDKDDIDRDQIRYGDYGKPVRERKSVIRSKLARKRSKSKSKGGFLNWHNMAASS